jgi:hypothetical protein
MYSLEFQLGCVSPQEGSPMKYKTFEEVPWYRREPGSLVFVLCLCCGPVLIALCILALTGDIYQNSYNKEGNLKVWGVGNKIAAILILVIQVLISMMWNAYHR